jgi:cell wall-associated NlpC family hydrolase
MYGPNSFGVFVFTAKPNCRVMVWFRRDAGIKAASSPDRLKHKLRPADGILSRSTLERVYIVLTFNLRAYEGLRSSRLRRLTVTSGLVSLAGLAAAVCPNQALARSRHHAEGHHAALIRVSTAKLRSGPGTTEKATALLDEGRSAVVVGHKGGWVKIRLDSGREGWLRHDLLDVARSTVHDENKDDAAPATHQHRARVSEIAAPTPHRNRRATRIERIAQGSSPVHKVTSLAATNDDHEKSEQGSYTPVLSDGDSATPETLMTASGGMLVASRGERLVRSALAYRGTPYRMGATGHGAFDCSGFTMYLFGKEGSSLPRTASEQYDKGQSVPRDQLQPGDLVFFKNTYKSGISHVGIYIGNSSFVHASGYGRGVRVDSLNGAFYENHYAGGRRPH